MNKVREFLNGINEGPMTALDKEQFNSIDFKSLEKLIMSLFKIKVNFKVKLNSGKVELKSGNIVNMCGPLSNIFKEVYLYNFGGNLVGDSSRFRYWLPISFRWEQKSGGGNGADLCTCWWDFNESRWIIADSTRSLIYGKE